MLRKIIFTLLAIVIIGVLAVLLFFRTDLANPYEKFHWGKFTGQCEAESAPESDHGKEFPGCDYAVPTEEIPTFREIAFPFSNSFDNTKSLPLMASAMIDLDNDGIDEIFVSGGVTQKDAIFKYSQDGFVNISSEVKLPGKPNNSTTYGASSADLDNDGNTDLIVTGEYGLYWYRNDNGKFTSHKIEVNLNEKSTAATTTLADYNRDGHLDIFLCNYISLDKMEGQTIFKDFNYGGSSLLLKNNGDQTFTDITAEAGLAYIHNTFQGVFVDIDNDNWLDLVVAYDTGEARTYRNENGKTFKMMPNPLTGKYAYPMGIAVGDYNNDGKVDFFFSNTGSSVPTFLARGDLAEEDVFIGKWMLWRNDGQFKFTDVAEEMNVADFEFSWGALFHDFNLDGLQDLVVAENYVDFPPHQLFKLPCRFLLQRRSQGFSAVEDQAGVVNKNYAISPLVSDFNQDGYGDLIYSNLDGEMKAFINEGGTNHFVGVRFPENAAYIGSFVTVRTTSGISLSDNYVIGEGLSSDQTSVLSFGLKEEKSVEEIKITFPDGSEKVLSNPSIDQVHLITK